MNQFKIGDRVRAVKNCSSNYFRKGEIGTVIEIYEKSIIVDFGYYRQHTAYTDEIELIEPQLKYYKKLVGKYDNVIGTVVRSDASDIHENALRMFALANAYAGDKPFPEIAQAIDDLNMHLKGVNTEIFKVIYNYFAQFQYEKTVEVFPEVGKEYEFSRHCDLWFRYELDGFKVGSHMFNKIRPIQPSRLEQLKAKHPNLSNDELIELLDILLTQMRNTK